MKLDAKNKWNLYVKLKAGSTELHSRVLINTIKYFQCDYCIHALYLRAFINESYWLHRFTINVLCIA